jgi:peptidoglycan/LPS O-acetylase OafA/YrhL
VSASLLPTEGRPGFRPDLHGLRGLAVLLVVGFHLQVRGFGGGFLGVDVFFVLSGFLMTQILWSSMAHGRFSLFDFLSARAARLWPALAAMVCTLLLLGALLLPPFDLRAMADQAAHALSFAANHYYHDRSGYNTRSPEANWLQHTWSLAVEGQFYLLYPLLLMAARGRLRVAVTLVAGVTAASLSWSLVQSQTAPSSAFFLLPARAWQLTAGGLAYFAACRWPLAGRFAAAVSHAGLALLAIGVLGVGVRHLDAVGLGAPAIVPVLGTALVVWAGHRGHAWLGWTPLQRLGTWSYSIYLWHWPLLVALYVADTFTEHRLASQVAVAAGSVLLGALSSRWIEARRFAAGRASAWRIARGPVAAMALAGAATSVVGASHGLDFRARGDGFFAGYAESVRPLYFPATCDNFMKTEAQLRLCPIERGDGAGRRVLVIGDSHAEHLFAWFARHSQIPVDFFTESECPPVPGFDRMQAGFHCLAYARRAWALAASGRYDTVVVSARWPTAALHGAPYCREDATGACRLMPDDAKPALVREALAGAIEGLLARGTTVVMVDGAPETSVRVPERLAREAFWWGAPRLEIDRRSVAELHGWLEPLFERLAQRPGFHRVSVRDTLCGPERCRVWDAALRRPVYLDQSHFDPVWIAAQAGLFTPWVQPVRAPLP